ncbi:MAG: ATP-binding cassette domain-containing protein [Bacteroidaceae bacterium]|nr:ATP-binding cassette domain-containing protein [Bacteroidaceae bacterium]
MIRLESISKRFDKQVVLDDINATFGNGKTNLIIGLSGAGKTVLLKCIVGLLAPDEGKVLYDGRDMVTLNKKERLLLRREMGMLFQSAALFDSMSVLENVMFPLDMFSDKPLDDRLARARFCLERVNLLDAQYKNPSELSGGMQKRAAIARAIALEPRYLFCDEPNSGLDPKTSLIIDELIHNITEEYGITTIVNTHDMNSVMGIGDHIIFLAGGCKSWEGTKDEILYSNNDVLNEFLFSSDLLRKVKDGALQRPPLKG